MANLTIVVPAALIPDLVIIADALFIARGINTTGMTTTQKGQRFVAELVRDQLTAYRMQQAYILSEATKVNAEAAAINLVSAAQATATTDANTITG